MCRPGSRNGKMTNLLRKDFKTKLSLASNLLGTQQLFQRLLSVIMCASFLKKHQKKSTGFYFSKDFLADFNQGTRRLFTKQHFFFIFKVKPSIICHDVIELIKFFYAPNKMYLSFSIMILITQTYKRKKYYSYKVLFYISTWYPGKRKKIN